VCSFFRSSTLPLKSFSTGFPHAPTSQSRYSSNALLFTCWGLNFRRFFSSFCGGENLCERWLLVCLLFQKFGPDRVGPQKFPATGSLTCLFHLVPGHGIDQLIKVAALFLTIYNITLSPFSGVTPLDDSLITLLCQTLPGARLPPPPHSRVFLHLTERSAFLRPLPAPSWYPLTYLSGGPCSVSFFSFSPHRFRAPPLVPNHYVKPRWPPRNFSPKSHPVTMYLQIIFVKAQCPSPM